MIAAHIAIDSGAAEPARLMRQLGLPFVEIDRIVRGLEKYGVVSPFDRGTRKVLMTRDGFDAAMKSRWAEVRADFA